MYDAPLSTEKIFNESLQIIIYIALASIIAIFNFLTLTKEFNKICIRLLFSMLLYFIVLNMETKVYCLFSIISYRIVMKRIDKLVENYFVHQWVEKGCLYFT